MRRLLIRWHGRREGGQVCAEVGNRVHTQRQHFAIGINILAHERSASCIGITPIRPLAEEMAADLRRFLEDKPIRARRMGAIERLWRWRRRNPVVAGLTVAVALRDL